MKTRKYGMMFVISGLWAALFAALLIVSYSHTQKTTKTGAPPALTVTASSTGGPSSGPTVTTASSSTPSQPREASVELGASFRIENRDGSVSHTPGVTYTADGKFFICGTNDGKIVIWETKTGKQVKTIECSKEPLFAISVNPNGLFAVWSDQKGNIGSVDLASGKNLATARMMSKFVSTAPDGKNAAMAVEKDVEIRHVKSLALIRKLPAAAGSIQHIAWSKDAGKIAVVDDQGTLTVYDAAEDFKPIYTVKKSSALYSVAFPPDGKSIAYGGHERVVYQYVFASEKEDWVAKDQPYFITALGYSPDGKVIAIGDESCDVWLTEVETKKRLFHSKHHVECWLNSVSFTPDGETFVFGCRPNSFAGKPSLYQPLLTAEASKSEAVQSFDKRIQDQSDRIRKTLETDRHGEAKRRLDALVAKREEYIKKNYPAATLQTTDQSVATFTLTENVEDGNELVSDLGVNFSGIPSTPYEKLLQLHTSPSPGPYNDMELQKFQEEITSLTNRFKSDPEVAQLIQEAEKLQKDRREEVQRQVKELQGSFNVNQWCIKKK